MRKLICLFFTACLFASCNDGILFDDYLNELGYEFKETNLSALDVLTSADYWEDNYLENVYSTKPNCEGKVYKPKDHLMPVGGSHKTTISVTLDRIRFYNIDSSGILSAPYNHYYSDSPIAHIDNNEIVFESGNVWKIVRYDEKKIVLDIHMPDFQFGGDHYPYGRITLQKETYKLKIIHN